MKEHFDSNEVAANENFADETENSVFQQTEADSLDSADTSDLSDSAEENQQDDAEISFADLGLDETTLAAIEKKGFVHPSPIQILAIPRLLTGDANVIARARTGTGKTAAFGLPLVQSLRNESDCVRAIILEPTRELAMQTATEMASFTTGRYPRTCVVYGGAGMSEQIRSLRKGVEIVVGTPGRVQDLMERGVLDISKIEYFILDEGDEMLDMGFVEDIENIFSKANPDCRVLLFSATIPAPILKIAQKFMGEYEIVEEEGVVEEPLLIDQKYWVVRENEKIEALVRLIDISPNFYGLVFVQRKSDADYVSKALDEKGYEAAALHGDIPQGQREKILSRFRSGKTRILVATDVAARGIDIGGLSHVVNYELPFDGPTYVHRIGRTGRAGSSGMAVTFVRPEERRRLQFLKNAIRRSAKGEMTEGEIPSVEQVLEVKKQRLFSELKEKIGVKKNSSETENQQEENLEKSEGTESSSVFQQMAQELCDGQSAIDVVASLLSAAYGTSLSKKHYGKINSFSSKGEKSSRDGRRDRSKKSPFVGENQIRLYVQMGWKDGYNPKKIAAFFSSLLGVRDKDVDAIDMADKFCLLNLPLEEGKRAIEMSQSDSSMPHIHQDTKVKVDFGGREERSRNFDDRDRGGFSRGRSRERSKFSGSGRGHDSKRFGGKKSNSRPGVHTATQREGQAALFKKSSKSNEY